MFIKIKTILRSVQFRFLTRLQSKYLVDMKLTDSVSKFPNRNVLYEYMLHYFYHFLPNPLRKHRYYFSREMRGFGEDALHAMWWQIFKEFKPQNCLEIGVYRGQTISLWALIGEMLNYNVSIHGVSPFSSSGDGVSIYLRDLDYLSDVQGSFKAFGLRLPALHVGFSTDQSSIDYISSRKWDLIYIDGNHDYEVALSDYLLCKESLARGGIIVLDDSSIGTDFIPPFFSFAGHPGPSRVMKENAMKEMKFIGAVGHNNIFQKLD